jgi:predicted nucleic acid-binding protein
VAERFPELDAGEATTLALALEHAGKRLVLMDDPLGRARAHAQGLPVTGLAGVLLVAKRARLVKSVRPFFDRLREHDFRISEEIVRAILEDAGEGQG